MEVHGQNNLIQSNNQHFLCPYFDAKEVIGVLLIEQIYEPDNIRCDYVKCPICKRGRLCDKPMGEKAMAIAIQGDSPRKRSHGVILKCPKCSKQFLISLTKE